MHKEREWKEEWEEWNKWRDTEYAKDRERYYRDMVQCEYTGCVAGSRMFFGGQWLCRFHGKIRITPSLEWALKKEKTSTRVIS